MTTAKDKGLAAEGGPGFLPVTVKSLVHLDRFSREHGKFRYCSCMRWRMTAGEFRASTAQERAATLERLVRSGIPVGILAFSGGRPVGWCSIAPRETYQRLEHYSPLARLDDAPVWSVVCFFVDRLFRRQSLTLGLLKAALDYAFSQGAGIVEGYPVKPEARSYTYMGSPGTYLQAGFTDVTPPDRTRLIMRRSLP